MTDSDDKRNRTLTADRRRAHRAHRDRYDDSLSPALATPGTPAWRVSRTSWRRAVRKTRVLTDRVRHLTRENSELRRLAYHDVLTGLLNRRGFTEHLERVVTQAARHGVEVAVLLLDVDKLKRINDTRGHAAGDVALRTVADALRRAVRSGDRVGRLSGDEFAVLLPHTDRRQARRIAERVRAALQRASVEAGVPVTVSAGVGVLEPQDAEPASPDRLLKLADDALYAAKRAGRDRVDDATDRACGE